MIEEGINLSTYYDSIFHLAFHGNPTFFPTIGGYNSLVSQRGTNIIRDKTLRNKIVSLYEFSYKRMISNGELRDNRFSTVLEKKSEIFKLSDSEAEVPEGVHPIRMDSGKDTRYLYFEKPEILEFVCLENVGSIVFRCFRT